MSQKAEFQADGRRVVLLTYREAIAVRDALAEWSDDAVLNEDPNDLGRAYRVLANQLNWIEPPERHRGRHA